MFNILSVCSMLERKQLIDVFLAKNSQLNLSAIRDPEWVYQKHILDSLELTKYDIIKPGNKVIDVGTGGGFPLMPLAMHYPEANFAGVDGRQKKTVAINDMLDQLGVKNAKAYRSRIEDYTWSFDVLTSRAVAYVDKLLERSYHLVRNGWYFILYKQNNPEEKKDLENICDKKNLILAYEHHYSLFEGDVERVLYIIKKP